MSTQFRKIFVVYYPLILAIIACFVFLTAFGVVRLVLFDWYGLRTPTTKLVVPKRMPPPTKPNQDIVTDFHPEVWLRNLKADGRNPLLVAKESIGQHYRVRFRVVAFMTQGQCAGTFLDSDCEKGLYIFLPDTVRVGDEFDITAKLIHYNPSQVNGVVWEFQKVH